MRIVVTGSGGFVGQNLLEHPRIGQFELLRAAWNKPALTAAMLTFKPDAVVHLAGHVGGIQANMADPIHFLLDNLTCGLNVVNLARQAKVPRLINVGSSCMYPLNAPQPFCEESLLSGPVEPTNEGYALAKLTVMKLCEYVNQAEGMAYKTLIPPGLYGRHAHFDGARSHLVGAVMDRLHKAARDGAESVSIWGDGTARREFLFAGDLADCIVTALERYDSVPEVMNVGTGADLSVDQWVKTIAGVVGYQGYFTHDPAKPSGAKQKVMDVSRATEWGWTAQTPLDEGLRLTYEWYQAHA